MYLHQAAGFAGSPIAINTYAFRRLSVFDQFANLIDEGLLLKSIIG